MRYPYHKKNTSIDVPIISQGMAMGGKSKSRRKFLPLKECLKNASAAQVPIVVAKMVVIKAIKILLMLASINC